MPGPLLNARHGLLATALCTAGAAQAMTGLLLLDPPPSAGLRCATGVSTWSLRTLPADTPRQQTWVYPAVDLQTAGGAFLSTDAGLGWNLSHDPSTQAGVRLSPWPARTAAFGRVGARLEQGVFFNRTVHPAVLLQTSLRHGAARGRDGWVGEAGMTSGLPLPGGELLGITVGGSWANGRYRSSYDGHGLALPGGWQDLQVAFSYEHRLDAHWRVDGQWLTARTTGLRRAGGGGNANEQALSMGLWRDWR